MRATQLGATDIEARQDSPSDAVEERQTDRLSLACVASTGAAQQTTLLVEEPPRLSCVVSKPPSHASLSPDSLDCFPGRGSDGSLSLGSLDVFCGRGSVACCERTEASAQETADPIGRDSEYATCLS